MEGYSTDSITGNEANNIPNNTPTNTPNNTPNNTTVDDVGSSLSLAAACGIAVACTALCSLIIGAMIYLGCKWRAKQEPSTTCNTNDAIYDNIQAKQSSEDGTRNDYATTGSTCYMNESFRKDDEKDSNLVQNKWNENEDE